MLRDELRKYLMECGEIPYHPKWGDTSNPDYVGPLAIEVIVDGIMKLVKEHTTDSTHPSEYKNHCIYCGRPAHTECEG